MSNQTPLLTVELGSEHEVVHARQRARRLAELLGFDTQDQSRISTAVSELARNAFRYATGGKVTFSLDGDPAVTFIVTVTDRGPGIRDLSSILSGRYESSTGMGIGIIGATRLADSFDIQSNEKGTTAVFGKTMPKGAEPVTGKKLQSVMQQLATEKPASAFEELQRQNQELIRALNEQRATSELLARRNADIERLNAELDETNRGVLALYAELDDKALQLHKASDLKSRFLSHMSHEFRTPLGSIRSISRILLDRMDGDLTEEQEKQIQFIQQAATDLTEMVDDLLDLAKIEAGKTALTISTFSLTDLFSTLRGLFRPLVQGKAFDLVFEDPVDIPKLKTDEGKLTQILRNFISNAVKFTLEGEIRVTARPAPHGQVLLSVRDTGIGIAPEYQKQLFQDFMQVDSPLQRKVKGSGLGLSLSKKLAELLGGDVSLESAAGQGSTFSVHIPIVCVTADEEASSSVVGQGAQ